MKKLGKGLIIFFTVIGLTVACCLSIANAKPFNKCLDDLAERIITDMERQGKVYLAVADFTDLEGLTSALGVFISEELLTRIKESLKLKIVERRLLNQIMGEHRLGLTGILDSKTVHRLGKILGVEAVCTGTIADLMSGYKINARVIGVETGEVFSAASVKINKTDALRILMRKYRKVQRLAQKLKPGKDKGPQYNLLVNGGFLDRYAGWKRQIGDMRQGSSSVEVVDFDSGKSGKALHIRHQGKGYIHLSQIVNVPTADLMFSATFQAGVHEGALKAFSGTGVCQIGIQYLDPKGYKLGQTVLLFYVKNPFADTPLIGVPRRQRDTYKCHYEELSQGKVYYEYRIDLGKEIEDNLLGINPDYVEEVAVILWCGATHAQAGAELWVADIALRMK